MSNRIGTGLPNYRIFSCANYTSTGGNAVEDFSITGVLASDKCFVVITDDGTNNVSVVTAICGTDKVTVTFSGDPGGDLDINILVIR